jgi:hypothetical protein
MLVIVSPLPGTKDQVLLDRSCSVPRRGLDIKLRNNVALAPPLTQVGNKDGLGREGEDHCIDSRCIICWYANYGSTRGGRVCMYQDL